MYVYLSSLLDSRSAWYEKKYLHGFINYFELYVEMEWVYYQFFRHMKFDGRGR